MIIIFDRRYTYNTQVGGLRSIRFVLFKNGIGKTAKHTHSTKQ